MTTRDSCVNLYYAKHLHNCVLMSGYTFSTLRRCSCTAWRLSHPHHRFPIVLKLLLDFRHHHSVTSSPRRDQPVLLVARRSSQPGQDAPAGGGLRLEAVGGAAGAGLDHHHLLLAAPALGAVKNHPHSPGARRAAAAPLPTGQSTEPGTVGPGAPAALVFKLNGHW